MSSQTIEIDLRNGRKIRISIDLDRETVSVSGARMVQAVKPFQFRGKGNPYIDIVPSPNEKWDNADAVFVNTYLEGPNETIKCTLGRRLSPSWGLIGVPTIIAHVDTGNVPAIVAYVSTGTKPEESLKARILPLQDPSAIGMDKLHAHPLDGSKTVKGRRLRPGEVLQKGDMFNSATGNWEPISINIFGIALENASPSIFIRPAA